MNSLTRKRRSSRTVVLAGLLALCGLLAAGCGAQDAQDEPIEGIVSVPERQDLNVVVISFDALRADVLSPYGGRSDATPNIDEFALQSLVFDNAYSVAPVTPTSFAAMFSGLLPTRVFHGWQFRATRTMAGIFSDAGYLSAALINNVQLTSERNFDRGFDSYEFWRSEPDRTFLDRVVSWLESRDDDRFFLWAHFLTPHAPYDRQPGAEHLYSEVSSGRFETTSGQKFETDDPDEIARIKELYLGEVWEADRLFGEVLESIGRLGLLDSSIVVLTSDHGEEFKEHGRFQHGRLYEEHLRIPLLLHHPELPARHEEAIVTTMDLMPTLLALVGESIDSPVDGTDLTKRAPDEETSVVGVSMTGTKQEGRWSSLLTWPHKLIVACGEQASPELYDLREDPSETHDLSEARVRRVKEMHRRLGKFLGGEPCAVIQSAVRGTVQTVGLDDESVEALRALGYVE